MSWGANMFASAEGRSRGGRAAEESVKYEDEDEKVNEG
jgi:hypothetical protein